MMSSSEAIITGTYRLQLHKGFTFRDLEGLIDYLHKLGVSTVYASPIFQSYPGSMHGYDVTDPHVLNPEIGTREELVQIAGQLKERSINWLQDIVPNHMAFHASNNRLMDVLERGPASLYYRYFDIDWAHPHPSLQGKLIVPFLGAPLGDLVREQQIKLLFSERGPGFAYGDQWFPLSVKAYTLLTDSLDDTTAGKAVVAYLQALQNVTASHKDIADWQRYKEERYELLLRENGWETVPDAVSNLINLQPSSLSALLQEQYYQLAYFRESSERMNYRRFFTVSELICLRMEDGDVFNEYHRLIADLYQHGLIQGLRIDHIDGLRDPAGYIQRLRSLIGNDCYLIAEKILEVDEGLPEDWALAGTSGYEFLSFTNRLLTDSAGWEVLNTYYAQLLAIVPAYTAMVHAKKRLILEEYMQGEWDNLTELFYGLPDRPAAVGRQALREAIGVFMVLLPVYRLYPSGAMLPDSEQRIIDETFAAAFEVHPELTEALQFLQGLWNDKAGLATAASQRIAVLQRLMQFTGPLTAKGVEDTTFYVYNAFISHNEVGDDPSASPLTPEGFHALMQERRLKTPLSLNATSTHDTKRGEDGRLRLNILSLFAAEWQELVEGWLAIYGGDDAPDLNEQYFIYQSLVAGFPIDGKVSDDYRQRLCDYMLKALHEAKVRSNWIDPDAAYEKRCIDFIHGLLDEGSSFLQSFRPFLTRVDAYLPIYAVAQTLLKITAPGIPDVYQGCELWDLSYVDPDNRRPVDYGVRQAYLERLVSLEQEGSGALLQWVHEQSATGVGKLFVTWKGLQLRRRMPELFLKGDYIPVYPNRPAPVVAFLRRHETSWVLVVVPMLHRDVLSRSLWKDVYLVLPDDVSGVCRDELTGRAFTMHGKFSLALLFEEFPAAMIIGAH
ncbi:MAG: malto-oligosyltrehalose synthase [Niastella sp.]|nr:malto-oligosyltrehalose synthase [Niastella sp.]